METTNSQTAATDSDGAKSQDDLSLLVSTARKELSELDLPSAYKAEILVLMKVAFAAAIYIAKRDAQGIGHLSKEGQDLNNAVKEYLCV